MHEQQLLASGIIWNVFRSRILIPFFFNYVILSMFKNMSGYRCWQHCILTQALELVVFLRVIEYSAFVVVQSSIIWFQFELFCICIHIRSFWYPFLELNVFFFSWLSISNDIDLISCSWIEDGRLEYGFVCIKRKISVYGILK